MKKRCKFFAPPTVTFVFLSPKPSFHRLKDGDKFFFANHVGNHRVQDVQKRPAEHAALIGKLAVSGKVGGASRPTQTQPPPG